MTQFSTLNDWVNRVIRPIGENGEIASNEIQALVDLAKNEDSNLSNRQIAIIKQFRGDDLLDALGKLRLVTHDPKKTENRLENAFAIVTTHADNITNQGIVVGTLIVPEYYVMTIVIRSDVNMQWHSSQVNFKNYYESHETKAFVINANVKGETLNSIFEYKEKVDSNNRIESKLPPGEPGRWRLKDRNGKEIDLP